MKTFKEAPRQFKSHAERRRHYGFASNDMLLVYFENACERVRTMGPRGADARAVLTAELNELRATILERMNKE